MSVRSSTPSFSKHSVSILNPFNREVNGEAMRRTLKVSQSMNTMQKPPTPFSDPPLGQIKHARRRLIREQTFKVRAQQVEYHNKLRDYELNKLDEEAELQKEQMEVLDEELKKENIGKKKRISDLRNTYEEQLHDIEIRKKQQLDEIKEFQDFMKKQDEKYKKEDELKREQMKVIHEERKAEYRMKLKELMDRKKKSIENEKAENERIRLENEEVEKRRAERVAEDERKRAEKVRIRGALAEKQAKEFEKIRAKQAQEELNSQTSGINADDARERADREKLERMNQDRKEQLERLQKERIARHKLMKKPFPLQKEDVDQDKQKTEESKRKQDLFKTEQLHQIEERRQRLAKLREEETLTDKKRLECKKEDLTRQMDLLKSIVPESSGLHVPEYRYDE